MSSERESPTPFLRGGGQTLVPIQFSEGATRYGVEPVDELTPERIFERRWALTVLELALARLRAEMGAVFEAEELAMGRQPK